MNQKPPQAESPLRLGPGQVLILSGSKFWVMDVITGKTVWESEKGKALPDLEIHVDSVLRDRLIAMDKDYAWTDKISDRNLYEKIVDSHAGRAHLNHGLEQTPVLPSTLYRRAKLLPEGKSFKVLLVGDDDLLSLPLALLGHEVTVLEIDPLTIKTIRHFEHAWGLAPITIKHVNLCKALPADLLERFDYCFTDPLSTYNCIKVFLSRAIACLREGGEVFIALSNTGNTIGSYLAGKMELEQVQRLLHFNFYYTSRFLICSYFSHYSHLRKTKASHPLVASQEDFSGDLFSFDKSFDYHDIEDFFDCAVFQELSVEQIVEKISEIFPGRSMVQTQPTGHYTLFIFNDKQSMRIRLNPETCWAGYDAVPLERSVALGLQSKLTKLLKPGRTSSRAAERNVGRD